MEYKITRLSQEPPQEYNGEHGTIYYIKAMLEGHNRPVTIGKKDPNALKVGDTVYGAIVPNPNYPTDKFKSENKPFSGGYKGQPKDNEAIRAQWAIGQAVAWCSAKKLEAAEIEATAKSFYAMVDRVKDSPKAEAVEVRKQPQPDPILDDSEFNDPINLDDIPF